MSRLKSPSIGGIEHVQSAGIGAEGGQDEAAAVAGEASPPDRFAEPGDARRGMKMTGDFAMGVAGLRLVAEPDRPDGEFVDMAAGEPVLFAGIVVAGDPDPVASRLQCRERRPVARREARCALVVVKTVAESDDPARREARDQPFEPGERLGGIVGRQHLPASGEGRALLEMQVGDDEQAFVAPP